MRSRRKRRMTNGRCCEADDDAFDMAGNFESFVPYLGFCVVGVPKVSELSTN
jgi:hypothetical protein